MRLARGSGLSGLAGIRRVSERHGVALLRPLIDLPKSRLVATLKKARVAFAEDPTNLDPRFARVRMRVLGPALAKEGLDASRLAQIAKRLARADAALAATVDAAQSHVLLAASPDGRTTEFNAAALFTFPSEIAIRLLGRAIGRIGDEGPVELGKLESLYQALAESSCRRPPAQTHSSRRSRRTGRPTAFGIPSSRAALPQRPVSHSGRGGNRLQARAFPC